MTGREQGDGRSEVGEHKMHLGHSQEGQCGEREGDKRTVRGEVGQREAAGF